MMPQNLIYLQNLFNFKIQNMRTIQPILLIVFVLFSTNIVSAQFGNNGMGGNGMNQRGNGMNQMGSSMGQQSQPEKPKEIPAEVTVAAIMEDMKPALNLDELQVIAISNVLTESIRTQGVLLKQEYSQEDQMKNFQALAETTDRKINQFLSQEQKEKYVLFREDRKNQKKTKEKSKSKKEKEKKN
jgi:hypothetical protein